MRTNRASMALCSNIVLDLAGKSRGNWGMRKWNNGMVEYWNIGMVEYWKDGILERWNMACLADYLEGLEQTFAN